MAGFRTSVTVVALVVVLGLVTGAFAQEQSAQDQQEPSGKKSAYTLPDVEVSGEKQPGPIQEQRDEPASISVLSKKSIETLGGPAQTDPYAALNAIMPSFYSENIDPYGLVNDSSVRIRGVSAFNFGSLSQTINGVPIGVTTGNGNSGNFVDMENINSVSLLRGPIPADHGFGFGDAGGAINLEVLAPKYHPGATFVQKFGSFNFNRTYARLDSGLLPTNTRIFGSISHSYADKWRGVGDTDRMNYMAGLAQNMLDDRLNVEVYGVYNRYNQDEYRPLTYMQSTFKSFYRGYDFNKNFYGSPSADYAYYGYNHQYFDQWGVFGKIEAKPWQGGTITFRPYYAGAKGRRYYSSANSAPSSAGTMAVQTYSVLDFRQRQYGYLAEIEQKINPVTVKVGYWYQNLYLFPGPPGSIRMFRLSGANSYFQNWGAINYIGDRIFHSPYIQTKADLGRVHLTGGLRYLSVTFPFMTAYNTAGVPDGSYDDILDSGLSINQKLSTNSSMKDVWLPNAGVSFDVTDHLTARFMYGRNYACPPQGPFYNTYKQNMAKLLAKGITLQKFWDSADLETSQNFDVGLRYDNGTVVLAPTFFYSKHYNKQVTEYSDSVGGSYTQTDAEAESIGGELEASWRVRKWLTLFGSASYNHYAFTKNLHTALNSSLNIKGNIVPNTPDWMLKTGFTATYKNFTATPLYRYVAPRYGDIENKQRVDGYHLLDLSLTYTIPDLWRSKGVTFSLDFQNILDQRYITSIRTGDDSTEDSSIYYYPGAPFNVVAGIKLEF